jgi:hypothetical protein
MLLIREIFTAKPGQAGKLATLFKKGLAKSMHARVMTDLIGNYNTVVMEVEVEKLADWEKEMEMYKSGKLDSGMDPETAKETKGYTDMYLTGRREIYQILE